MPISEYEAEMKAAANADGKDVDITVVSRQCDAAGLGIFGMPEDAVDSEGDGAENEYSMNCRGTLCVRDGRLLLTYKEPPFNDDSEPCDTEISFATSDIDCITVTRSGEISASFVIQNSQRSISVYKTPFGNIEMCVFAKKVENKLTENGGRLYLDYTVELKGLTAQRTKMSVTVRTNDQN